MTTSQKPTQRSDEPLVSLRTFVLIVVALAVAVGAGLCVYFHLEWLMVAATAFAATLAFLNRSVE
jgi:hypothetical protein